MERSSVIVAGDEPRERHLATLTLRRGATTWGSWGFDAQDVGVTISVGGSAGCDWQIAAPGVGPLLVLFTGECLLIKNDGPRDDVWLNGARLWPSWVPLEHGDVVELGMSCIEVAIGAAQDLISGERELHAWLPHTAQEPETDRNWKGEHLESRRDTLRFHPRVAAKHNAQRKQEQTPTAQVRPRASRGGPTARIRAVQSVGQAFQAQTVDAVETRAAAEVRTLDARRPTARLPDWPEHAVRADQLAPAHAPVVRSLVRAGTHVPNEPARERQDEELPTILGKSRPSWTSADVTRGILVSTAVALAYAGWVVILDHL